SSTAVSPRAIQTREGARSTAMEPQNDRLYVKMNALGTQFRIGGENFAWRISRSASTPNASSPVVLFTARAEVTLPRTSTFASTVTMPCALLSEKAGVGVLTNW